MLTLQATFFGVSTKKEKNGDPIMQEHYSYKSKDFSEQKILYNYFLNYNKQRSRYKLGTARIFRTVSLGVCKKVARNMLTKDPKTEISGI